MCWLALACREPAASAPRPSAPGGGAGGTVGSAGGAAGSGGISAVDRGAVGVIVVLGSSTAAGTGPSRPELAWVELYRTYLKREFPKFKLTNLAVGGYTTYQIQATGYTPPANRPAPVAEHNITFALGLSPDALIINLPTNDIANEYPWSEQAANYDRVTKLAAARGALVWVTTSQPRNFADDARLSELVLVRDAIRQKFGARALDFWTPFARANATIKASYDAGDGTHMNDAAHARLVEQVIRAKIPEATLSAAR